MIKEAMRLRANCEREESVGICLLDDLMFLDPNAGWGPYKTSAASVRIEVYAFKLQACEENHFHQFLMEREKINYFWIVEKKTLTEKQVGSLTSLYVAFSKAL